MTLELKFRRSFNIRLELYRTTNRQSQRQRPPSHPQQENMGKVHGSLARAGKVKSQTPKVEKQEKKKVPKGRAKKRMLYNRRFVNVTTLPGGKRRMNANPEK
ncbi:ribosomal protein S30-domain-containing protein [Dichomitus squalens]|uniref:Ribosomal protein S30-domain-containing protein n=2 Tax=Dichomitus squalens TaxID=114155 RepID=A0A4Q9PCH1_9APHY|nr:ribosomal protein S30-domain-containing protein [Dichomitus squalens]